MKRAFSWLLVFLCALAIFPLVGCKREVKSYTTYEITAEYSPENRTLAGTAKVVFKNNREEEISLLKFNLYPNAYRKDALYRPVSKTYEDAAYYAGESYGEMAISSVSGAKSWEVMGEDENILYVYLQSTLYPGDSVVLNVGFITKLALVNHRTGVTENAVNLGNAFPVLCGFKNGGFYECAYYSDGDPFYSDCADYKLTLTLPKEYVVCSTGEILEESGLESKKTYTMSATNVRDFALVLSKNYRVLRQKVGETQLAYYYYADEEAEETLRATVEAFAYFQKTFGEYPYPAYSVAQTGFCLGGMEYSCLTMLSDGLSGAAKSRALVHETAHQWWGITVGSDQIENAWQDEGLAEYSALLFFEKYEKYGFTREGLVADALREYRSYYDVYGSVLGRTDTRMTRHLKEYLSDYEYRCLSYDKAIVMLDTLRKSVGDSQFLSSLKKYYKTYRFDIASVGGLIGSFEKGGLDVHGFFESFLQGKAVL